MTYLIKVEGLVRVEATDSQSAINMVANGVVEVGPLVLVKSVDDGTVHVVNVDKIVFAKSEE